MPYGSTGMFLSLGCILNNLGYMTKTKYYRYYLYERILSVILNRVCIAACCRNNKGTAKGFIFRNS